MTDKDRTNKVNADDLQSDDEVRLEQDDDGVARETDAPQSPGTATEHKPQKLNRQEVLARLMEKNETILRLTRENARLEKELDELKRGAQTVPASDGEENSQDGEVSELKDRLLRTVAEFENYRKRSRKEWELLQQQSKSEVILEILSVVDDFERAFSVVEDSESSQFVEGIRLIYSNLIQTLEKLGVTEVDSHLEPFDPNLHMAVGQMELEDIESGLVAEVVQKGYRLDENVIRPARVIVAK